MFKKNVNNLISLKFGITKDVVKKKIFSSRKILSYIIDEELLIYTGNMFVKKTHSYLFKTRNIKFNTFFKKPLVRPTKKKK